MLLQERALLQSWNCLLYTSSGTYPTVDSRTKAATGQTAALAKNGSGQYTDWAVSYTHLDVYKRQGRDCVAVHIGRLAAIVGVISAAGVFGSVVNLSLIHI